jgi:CRISPR system Cascade subunit CasE
MAGFPTTEQPSARAEFAALFRVDGDYTIVQSSIAPDYSRVLPLDMVQTKSFEIAPINGVEYVFRLAINSIKRQSRTGRDIAIDPHDWIAARNFGAEFDIRSATHSPVTELSGDRRVSVNRWDLSGTLTVANAEMLTAAMSSGIGRGRAWGCGLLSIVPTHSG